MSKLKLGMIPAGSACPFLSECGFKRDWCPGANPAYEKKYRIVPRDYSCAVARAHNMFFDKLPEQSTADDKG